MPARLHRGAVRHCWDHLVIGLANGDGASAYASLYAVSWSGEIGPGHVAFVRGVAADGVTPRTLTLADPPDVGERMRDRLRALGGASVDLDEAVRAATFTRVATGSWLAYRIEADDLTVVLTWDGLTRPFWAEGQAPAFTPAEDIWAVFVEATAASVEIDGVASPGAPFQDDAWLPKLGRSLSSAHLAFAEVRVAPEPPAEGRVAD